MDLDGGGTSFPEIFFQTFPSRGRGSDDRVRVLVILMSAIGAGPGVDTVGHRNLAIPTLHSITTDSVRKDQRWQ